MRWVGKVIGGFIGLAAGGPFGAMLGAALGHGVDQGLKKLQRNAQLPPGDRQRIQSAFFTATFSTMGHLSKADGRVSEAEIALAESIMTQLRLSPEMRSAAIKLFRLGKSVDFDLPAVVETFRRECRGQRSLIQMFLEIQIQAAYVDGEPTFAQRQVLSQIRAGLNVPEILFKQLETLVRLQRNFAGSAGPQGAGSGSGSTGGSRRRTATHRTPNLREAYAVLGVTPKDSDATIKRAYRRLLSQHHPDKLVSKGLPEEMMKMATQKTHEIRRAYEMIQSARAA
ncbi:co-chaperone DjlA [Lamprobacter modestohalophilus]|uniref:co-chaperone DjlA n=1 Tax=Lamprobacter modestohalophilus TaxID=1064514 RepID=UPI002ADED8E5|nr:co-chaperone DjlA [Lamprobacter modestohalophilus]MEA1050590.1 co-chaperone DjlA [Lamprobacter modestohalophilus]